MTESNIHFATAKNQLSYCSLAFSNQSLPELLLNAEEIMFVLCGFFGSEELLLTAERFSNSVETLITLYTSMNSDIDSFISYLEHFLKDGGEEIV